MRTLNICFLAVFLPILGTGCSSIDAERDIQEVRLSPEAQEEGVRIEAMWECRDFVYDEEVALEIGRFNITVSDIIANKLSEFLEDHNASIEELKKDKDVTDSLDQLKEYYAGFVRLSGEKGEAAFYSREGLNHRWEWDESYGFVIEPSGRGYYYDFTDAQEGESVKPSDTFKCKRK